MVRHKFSGPGSALGMWIFLGFQWYAIKLSKFIQVVVVARKESQPAVQAASCAAASRLCRHSAQTHTPYNASVLSRVLVWKPLHSFAPHYDPLNILRDVVVEGVPLIPPYSEPPHQIG